MAIYTTIKTYRGQTASEETREFKSLLQAKRNAPKILGRQEVISIYQNGVLVACKKFEAGRIRWI